ncbi:Probable WRKY transcription factor 35 [Linum grandiflorum]
MEMENYQGDLTDVVRATSTAAAALPPDTWEFPPPSAPPPSSSSSTLNPLSFSSALLDDDGQHHNLFGDPFSNFSDPLLHAPPIAGSPHTLYFPPPPPKVDLLPAAAVAGGCGVGGGGGYDFLSDATASTSSTTAPPPAIMAYHHTKMFGENTFAGIQISTPGTSGAGVGCVSKKTEGVGTVCSATEIAAVRSPRIGFNKGVEDQMINNNNSNNNNNNNYKSTSCLAGPVQQISSPRNLGIKRRWGRETSKKSQAKKVVCIPAPATVNSRPSGEVVPSDLWAWRKYGQKPIKGSPYPRGDTTGAAAQRDARQGNRWNAAVQTRTCWSSPTLPSTTIPGPPSVTLWPGRPGPTRTASTTTTTLLPPPLRKRTTNHPRHHPTRHAA